MIPGEGDDAKKQSHAGKSFAPAVNDLAQCAHVHQGTWPWQTLEHWWCVWSHGDGSATSQH